MSGMARAGSSVDGPITVLDAVTIGQAGVTLKPIPCRGARAIVFVLTATGADTTTAADPWNVQFVLQDGLAAAEGAAPATTVTRTTSTANFATGAVVVYTPSVGTVLALHALAGRMGADATVSTDFTLTVKAYVIW